jgi:membrane dipeptidase
MTPPHRLIDLHCDWLLQYVPDCNVFDPAFYPEIVGCAGRPEGAGYFGQVDGYLTGTSAAVIACFRRADDWTSQARPWTALAALIARIEAEFPGRVLIGPGEHTRWLDDTDGFCWALIGVEGFDPLVRTPADLDHLPGLFERGARLFQPVYGATSLLAGSSQPGDDRGLTDLGRSFLQVLADLGAPALGPRPILDLAHLNPRAMAEVLDWLKADAIRPTRLLPAYSHGAPWHLAFDSPRALAIQNLARLRTLGGTVGYSVGPPFFDSSDRLRGAIESTAALPYLGQPGFTGIAIGTDFLGVERALPSLGTSAEVVAWLHATFAPEAAALIDGNARSLIERAVGARCGPG